MAKASKDARTFSEWKHVHYKREHYIVAVLIGILLGSLIMPPGPLPSTMKADDPAEAGNLNPASPVQRQ